MEHREHPRLDSRQHLQLKAILGFRAFASDIAESFVTLYADQLGVTKSLIGLLSGFRNILTTSLQFFWAEISDQLGKRKIFILTGMLLNAVFWILLALTTDNTWFVILASLQGAALSMAVPAYDAIVRQMTTLKDRPHVITDMLRTSNMFGLAAMLLSIILLDWAGIPVLFMLAAASLVLGVWIFSAFKEPYVEPNRKSGLFLSFKSVALDHIRVPALRKLIIPIIIHYSAVYLMGSFLSIYVVQEIGTSKSFLAWCILAYIVAGIVSYKVWEPISQRHGRKSAIINGVYVNILGIALIAFARNEWWVMLGYIANGIGWAGINIGIQALLMDIIPEMNTAEYLAFTNVVIGATSLLFPILGGFIAEATSVRMIITISFLMRMVSIPFFFRAEEKEPKRFYPLTRELSHDMHRGYVHFTKHAQMFLGHRHKHH